MSKTKNCDLDCYNYMGVMADCEHLEQQLKIAQINNKILQAKLAVAVPVHNCVFENQVDLDEFGSESKLIPWPDRLL